MPKRESLKIDFNKRQVKGVFKVYNFIDHGSFVVYIPSLNLTSYGDNKGEAVKSLFEVIVGDFFDNLLVMPEYRITEELKKLGWQRGRVMRKKFEQTVYVDKDGVLKNFNLKEETVINEEIMAV